MARLLYFAILKAGETVTDEEYMQMALDLAEKARGCTSPNPMVGCVIVNPEGKIVGKGYHHKAGQPHAEIMAMRDAGDQVEGCTAYVTLEPCQMCAGAIVQARIPEVVMGCMNPKAGCAGSILNILEIPQFNHQVKVTRGILETECSQMLKTFFEELRIRNKQEKAARKASGDLS